MSTDYTALLTSAHRGQPRLTDTVSLLTSAISSISDTISALPSKFSVDDAVGAQLDVVGEWVGMSRYVRTPVSDPYFSWDTADLGWDQGYWKPPFAPTEGVVLLDDSTYRAAIRLKILTNHWQGRQEAFTGIPVRLENAETENLIFAVDHMNMTMTFYVVGPAISKVLLAVISQEGVLPKPMGVRIVAVLYSATPVFALSTSTTTQDGLDVGSFLF